ncbi:MAG: hypothetical protein NXH97_12455 [Rhodobacteraceae bacterium]|nr:hypothetical protein [Paracoccaceae bacterium]
MLNILKYITESQRFCAFAPKRGKMKERVMLCAQLSERSCSKRDYHFSPRSHSAQASQRATDRKTAPHIWADAKPRVLVFTRKAVMS